MRRFFTMVLIGAVIALAAGCGTQRDARPSTATTLNWMLFGIVYENTFLTEVQNENGSINATFPLTTTKSATQTPETSVDIIPLP